MSAANRLEAALVEVIRRGRLPQVHQRVGALAGVRLDRAGYVVAGAVARLGPVRQAELAAELQLDASTASRHVCALERAGLIAREPDPDDRRAQLVRLTPAGTTAVRRLREGRRAVIEEAVAAWSEQEREQLADLLERLSDDLERVTTRSTREAVLP